MGISDYSSFSFSPNGKINASSGYDGEIKLWNKDFKEIQSFRAPIGGALKVYFNQLR
ncbi:hypothetical protein [uncultured Nostoc sp.]|uniref:hypothetical protein n=1 Tax=uncultured Nostoc sp. TaxID=340711 RepID=UPI002631C994|nr:hypothetical protein [uncultured Nostoc sp.]